MWYTPAAAPLPAGAGEEARGQAHARRALDEARAGLVFDLRLSCRGATALFEVKAVQYSTSSSGSWYRTRQLRAVDQRALRVLPERFRDARRVDDLLFPLHPQGPVLHRLHALGGVEPLVVGAFAERNQRAHRLVSELAEAAGPRVQRESAVDAQSAKGLAVWHLKRGGKHLLYDIQQGHLAVLMTTHEARRLATQNTASGNDLRCKAIHDT